MRAARKGTVHRVIRTQRFVRDNAREAARLIRKKANRQKGTITMVKTSVSTRVLSVALSAALCCTLVPAEGIAFADETNATTEQSAQASADEAAAAQANDVVEAPADDAPAAPVDRV